MLPFQHVLLPVDFSDRSAGMVRAVRPLVEHYQSRVSLLHVFDSREGGGEERRALREQSLRNFASAELPHVDVTVAVHGGVAEHEIVGYAEAEAVDLIAMATHGGGRFRRFLIGSVTAKVLHDAKVPVLTGAHIQEQQEPMKLDRILCCVDLNPHSEQTLSFATQLARDLGARLGITHVVEIPDPRLGLNFGADWQEGLVMRAKERLHALQREAEAPGDVYVKIGAPGERVQRLAEAIHAGLVVVGRSTEGVIGPYLRTDAYDLIRRCPCPVISV